MASMFDRFKKDPDGLAKAWDANDLQEMERLVSGKGCLHTHYLTEKDSPDMVPLALVAAKHNRIDVLEMLHRHRVRLDAMSINGEKLAKKLLPEMNPINIWHKLARPLDSAVRENRAEAVRFLHHAGVDISARAHGTGHTAMHVALHHDCPKMLELLVELGGDINAQDKHLNTPLHWAFISSIWKNHPVGKLLELGANPNIRNHAGRSPLSLALSNVGRSPLSLALSSGDIKTAAMLLDYGAEITQHERLDCEDHEARHALLDQHEHYRRMRQEAESITISSSRSVFRM